MWYSLVGIVHVLRYWIELHAKELTYIQTVELFVVNQDFIKLGFILIAANIPSSDKNGGCMLLAASDQNE